MTYAATPPPIRVALTCLIATGLISGCNPPDSVIIKSEAVHHEVASGIERGRSAADEENSNLAVEYPGSYLGHRTPIRIEPRHVAIPKQLRKHLELNFADPITAEELGRLLSNQTSVRVNISSDLKKAKLENLAWSGVAVDFLDQLSGQFGIYWRWKNAHLEMFRKQLRTWTLYFPGVTSKWEATIGLSGSVAGAGGSDLNAEDQVSILMDDTDTWTEIEATVRDLLSPEGSISVSPQAGELAVVDTPESLDRIDEWVRSKNRQLTSQVVIAIELYEIEQSDTDESGFSINGFVQRARNNGLITLESLNNSDRSTVSLKYDKSSDPTSQSIAAIISEAAGENRVSKLTSSIVRGLNRQPIPVFFGDETSYLQKREVVESENGTSVRLIPGTLQNGIALNVVPKILPDTNQMLLYATIRTTHIKSISRFPVNAAPDDPVIQLPDLETRSMLIPVLLRSGETLVVAGLETGQAAGESSRGLLSFGKKIETSRTSLVLLITPRIIMPDIEIVQRLNKHKKDTWLS